MSEVHRSLISGKEIGDHIVATCEHPDCEVVINRGVDHACGEVHEGNHKSCDGYFCGDHLFYDGKTFVCQDCLDREID